MELKQSRRFYRKENIVYAMGIRCKMVMERLDAWRIWEPFMIWWCIPDGIEKYDEEVIKIGKTHMVKTAPRKMV